MKQVYAHILGDFSRLPNWGEFYVRHMGGALCPLPGEGFRYLMNLSWAKHGWTWRI